MKNFKISNFHGSILRYEKRNERQTMLVMLNQVIWTINMWVYEPLKEEKIEPTFNLEFHI